MSAKPSPLAPYVAHYRAEFIAPEVQRLINLCTFDLHFGPIGETDDDGDPWPGFEKACEIIADSLEFTAVWVDTQSPENWSWSEPEWIDGWEPTDDDDDPPPGEWSEDWCRFDAHDVKRAVLGKDLAPYVD